MPTSEELLRKINPSPSGVLADLSAKEEARKGGISGFLKGEITGQPTQTGILGGMFRGTLGTKGLLGVGQLPGKVAGTALLTGEQEKLAKGRERRVQLLAQLVERIKTMTEGARKEQLKRTVKDNMKALNLTREQEEALERQMITPREAVATTARAGVNVALLGAPTPTTALGAGAQTGLAGVGLGAAEAFEAGKDPKEIAKQAFITGVTSAVAGAGMFVGMEKVAKPVVNWLTKELPKDLYNSVLRVSKKILKHKKSPTETLIREGHWGTLGQLMGQVNKGIEVVSTKIDDILAKNPGTIKSSELIDDVINKLQKKYGTAYTKKQLEDMILKSPIADLIEKPELSLVEANSLRKTLDRILRESFFMKEAQVGISREVMGVITNTLRGTIQKLSDTVDEFALYADYIRAQDLLDSAIAHTDKYWGLGLKDLVIGGAFGLRGGLEKGVGAVAVKKGLESAWAKTLTGKFLDRLGQEIRKLPIDKMGKVSRVAIMNLIKELVSKEMNEK